MSDDTKTNIDNDVPEPVKSTITIHKYEINPFGVDEEYVKMPEGAEIIHVYDRFVWARVDTSKPIVERHIVSCRTGGTGCVGKYIGTVTYHTKVRHLFDCGVGQI